MIRWLPWILAGCSEFGLDPIDDPNPPPELVVVQQSFVQQPLPALDVLFVVDATTSMEQEIQALSASVGSLLDALDELEVRWQLGIVPTLSVVGNGTAVLRGHPWVLTSELDDVEGVFAEALPTPSPLSGEAGIAAAISALDEARGGRNHGFRRSGAALVVVFVSDDDDTSAALLEEPPVDALLATFEEEEALYGAPVRASALVGDLPVGCSSAIGAARPAADYHDAVARSGGVVGSVCSPDYGEILEGVAEEAVAYPNRFALDRVPASEEVQVSIDGASVEGWQVDVVEGVASLVFDEPPPAASRIDVSYVVSNTLSATTSSASDASVPQGSPSSHGSE